MYNITLQEVENRKKIIGDRIRKERKALNLTQDEFKERIHISARQTIARWENGKALPTLEDFIIMCELFRCDIGYLLCEHDEKTRTATDIRKETGLSETAINRIAPSVKGNSIQLITPVKEAERKALNGILEFNGGDILRLVTRFLFPNEVKEVEELESTPAKDAALCMLELSEELHALKTKLQGGANNG